MYPLYRSRIRVARAAAAALLVSAVLAGCSEHFPVPGEAYLDRRETIAPLAGDALAANRVAQTVDPWSPASANRNIAYSGERMQAASERYRTGRVIPPVNATTSSMTYQQAAQAAQAAAGSQGSSTSGGAAPIK
jgi:hypothetical protein